MPFCLSCFKQQFYCFSSLLHDRIQFHDHRVQPFGIALLGNQFYEFPAAGGHQQEQAVEYFLSRGRVPFTAKRGPKFTHLVEVLDAVL